MVPNYLLGSNHIGYDDWATYSVHESYYQQRNSLLSSFQLSIEGEMDNLNVSGTVHAEKVAAYSGQNLVLHLVVTESNIPENWYGETELDYVERLMYPDANGSTIDFTANSSQYVNFNLTLDSNWVANNCELVFFIQDNDTKEILQGNKINLDDISLSIESLTQKTSSFVFPNPVSESLSIYSNLNIPIHTIQLFDSMGRSVYSVKNYETALDVSKLSKGVYFIDFMEGSVKKTLKIIKI